MNNEPLKAYICNIIELAPYWVWMILAILTLIAVAKVYRENITLGKLIFIIALSSMGPTMVILSIAVIIVWFVIEYWNYKLF